MSIPTRNSIIVLFGLMTIAVAACGDPPEHPEPPAGAGTGTAESVCGGQTSFEGIPEAFIPAVMRYTTVNTDYALTVCSEDSDGDGQADFIVIESLGVPDHESVYHDENGEHYEDYDYETNAYKFDEIYDGQRLGSAGRNMIEEQLIVMKMPIAPVEASDKVETPFGAIGIALNGVAFFNENAAPGDEITEELFTFDQCSGHPQQRGVYHYHVDPVCLIRDLGGDVDTVTTEADGTEYEWLEDTGTNAGLLLGFLADGFPVYGPQHADHAELDCNGEPVTEAINGFNGHSHCTAEFDEPIFHYHVKTAESVAGAEKVFWVTDAVYFGEVGEIAQ